MLATALVAACSSGTVNTVVFDEGFGGTFPGSGWQVAGAAPAIDTTAGNPAPSLTWPMCLGSSGGLARVATLFDGAGGLLAAVDFAVTGSAATATTNVDFHAIGLDGADDAAAVIFPPPTNRVTFEIDGQPVNVPLPADHLFHQLVLEMDGSGLASWFADGAVVMSVGPVSTANWGIQLECAEVGTAGAPIPVLLDNVHIEAVP